MNTVWICVDSSKEVGDLDHLKVFASKDARRHGHRRTTGKASHSNMKSWSER
jgi:hypothetical protein